MMRTLQEPSKFIRAACAGVPAERAIASATAPMTEPRADKLFDHIAEPSCLGPGGQRRGASGHAAAPRQEQSWNSGRGSRLTPRFSREHHARLRCAHWANTRLALDVQTAPTRRGVLRRIDNPFGTRLSPM